MKHLKKYNLYKIDMNGKAFSLFDLFFYLKLIAIILFAVIDTVIDLFYLLGNGIKIFFQGDWFDVAIRKYLVYSRKMKNLYSIKNRSMISINSEITKIQNELFLSKERKAFFNSISRKKRSHTKKHATC